MPDGPDHPETWIFHMAMAWRGQVDDNLSYKERLALIKEKAKGLGDPARSAFMWMPDNTEVHKADISYWIPHAWDNHQGRLTLIGDAAHPMPPCKFFRILFCRYLSPILLSQGAGLKKSRLISPPNLRSRPRSQPLYPRRSILAGGYAVLEQLRTELARGNPKVRRRDDRAWSRRGGLFGREWLHAP